MTRQKEFQEKRKDKHGDCSPISTAAWCALKFNGTSLKLHDVCPNSRCKFQKQISFSPSQFQLEDEGFKCKPKKMKKELKKHERSISKQR